MSLDLNALQHLPTFIQHTKNLLKLVEEFIADDQALYWSQENMDSWNNKLQDLRGSLHDMEGDE